MKKQKLLSILSLAIVSFIAIIVLHQPSFAESLPLNRYDNLNLYSITTNNNKQFSNNREKLTSQLVANNWQNVNNWQRPAREVGIRVGRACLNSNCKNIILSFLIDNWLWIGGGIGISLVMISMFNN